jgi:hypothetical protein
MAFVDDSADDFDSRVNTDNVVWRRNGAAHCVLSPAHTRAKIGGAALGGRADGRGGGDGW